MFGSLYAMHWQARWRARDERLARHWQSRVARQNSDAKIRNLAIQKAVIDSAQCQVQRFQCFRPIFCDT